MSLFIFLTASLPASAHVDALLEGVDVVALPGAEDAAVEASFGLLWPGADGAWQWTCHEAVTADGALITPRYQRIRDGSWAVVVPTLDQARDPGQAVYTSTDGCTWTAASGLTDVAVGPLAFDPYTDAAVAGAASLDPGADNRLYLSADAGRTWTPTDVGGTEHLFRSVRFSRGAAGAVWATAVWYDTGLAWVYRSTDGGASWDAHAVEVDNSGGASISVDVVGVHPDDPDVAWLVRGPYGADELLRTTDGGATTEVVLDVDGDVVDGVVDVDGGVWIVVSGREIWYAPDGETFAQVDGAPEGLGLEAMGDQVLLATRMTYDGVALSTATVGEGVFTPVLHVGEIAGPVTCDAGTHAADRCDPLWPDLAKRLGLYGTGDTADTGDTAIDTEDTEDTDGTGPGETGPGAETGETGKSRVSGPDCGCATGAPAGWAALAGLAVLARRRRR